MSMINLMNGVTLLYWVISFLAGFWLGFLTRPIVYKHILKSKGDSITRKDVQYFVVFVVMFVWSVAVLTQTSGVNPEFEVPIGVHGIMGVIVGFFFKDKKDDQ